MKITVDMLSFDTVEEFTDYLERTYGRGQLASKEVLIRLKCEAFEADHVAELVAFLLNPDHPNVYKLQIISLKYGVAQMAFDNAYLASKRRKLALDFQQPITELAELPRSFQPHTHVIRKSKKNWVEGTQGPSLNIQIQARESSLSAQPLPVVAMLRTLREAAEVAEVVHKPPVAAAELGELIERETINARAKQFANKLFQDKAPELQTLWERLVGEYADKIHDVDRKITHVQNTAMEQIIRYYPEFTYGLILDNLPAGFYLQTTNDGHQVLCYSKEPEEQHLETITPLTIIPELADPVVNGSFQQFMVLGTDSPNNKQYELKFAHLFASKIASETRQKAFTFFLDELEQEPLKLQRIDNLLMFLPLTDLHYQGLAYVLVNAGVDGVLLVLQQFKTLHEQELFNDLQALFLDNPQNYAGLATPKGLKNLQKLSELTPEQYMWWRSLVTQHKAAGARTNFNELFDAYHYFLTELGELAQNLPAGCPLEHIRHMKPALARALFIIKNSADPEEQLLHLNGLNYDVYGAYYASRYEGYRLVSQHMRVIPEPVVADAVFKNTEELCAFFTEEDRSAEELLTQFYRFIGIQDWAYNFDMYQRIEAQIRTQYGDLGNEVQSALLCIILLTTTGQRSCLQVNDPCAALFSLINKIMAVAKIIAPETELKTGVKLILSMFMGSLRTYDQENMPSLNELNSLCDMLLLNHGSAIAVPETAMAKYIPADNESLKTVLDARVKPQANTLLLMTLFLDWLHVYGRAGVSFIEHYQKRFLTEQAETTAIKSFNINVLLMHLHPTAKLGQYLSTLFAEQTTSLAQFIVLMSLISDEIPPYNEEAEVADSEFETKVKKLASLVLTLQEEHRDILFSLLNNIHIEASYTLPALEQLIELVQWVKAEENNLDDDEQQQALILNRVMDTFPNIKIGSSPVMSLQKPEDQDNYGERIADAVSSLQTADEDFDDYLLDMTPYVFDVEFDEDIEKKLSEQFDELSKLINTLIYIKNNNPHDFRRCIPLLSKEVTADDKEYRLRLVHLGDLLAIFSRSEDETASEQLDLILSIMNEQPHYSEEQFDKAIQQIITLAEYREQGIFDSAAYIMLLRLSLKHNLSQDSVFPFEHLIRFYEFCDDPDSETMGALFDAWVDLIKKIDLQQVDNLLLQRVIERTLFILQNFSEPETSTIPVLLTLLTKACKTGSAAEFERYDALLVKFTHNTDEPVLNAWVKILTSVQEYITDDTLHLLFSLLEGLKFQQLNLADILSLFESPPYPDLEQFITLLNGSAKELKAYITHFDRDPKKGRAEQYDAVFGISVIKTAEHVVQEQFDMSQVASIVAEIKTMADGAHLTAQEQYELAQQITYINALGKDHPLVIKGMDPVLVVNGKDKDLTSLSRAELRTISDHLIVMVRKPNASESEKLKAQLNLIAVLREHYERTTGQIIYAPQLAALLLSLKNERCNMVMELSSERDTTVSNALLAVMQWVRADGGAVDLCYANREQVKQDYRTVGHRDFFTALGINSSCLEADSPTGTYKKEGINYSTMGDLGVYRKLAKHRHETLIAEKNGYSLSSNLILCSTDLFALNDKQLFSLAVNKARDNPNAWIYPVINEFINQPQFKSLNKLTGWSNSQDLSQLKGFLDLHTSTGFHKSLLKEIAPDQLNLWMNSAIAAQRLVKGEDFEILEHTAEIHSVVPCILKAPQLGTSIAQEVQQFLHARLEKEYAVQGWKFPINPVTHTVAQASVKELIDDYKAQGRIIGLSKTLDKDKLGELCDRLNATVSCKVPPCLSEQQKELIIAPTKHEKQYLSRLHEAFNAAEEGQPIVLIAQDADEVHYLEEQLKAYFGTSRTIGVLSRANKQTWLKEQAGTENRITITTDSLLGGRAYFNTELPEGFLTIQTYLDSASKVRGLLGRISRYEKPGKYTAIYESQDVMYAKSWNYYDRAERELMFTEVDALRCKRNEVAALHHYYSQTVSGMHYVAMKQFDEWQAFLSSIYPQSELSQLSNDLLVLKDDLACTLSEQWQECVQHLGPHQNYPGLYERKDGTGQNLLVTNLHEALKNFEAAIVKIWTATSTALQAKTVGIIEHDSVNELHSNYLANVSITEQYRAYRLAELKNKEEKQNKKEKAQRCVAAALDVNGAMMRYFDGDVDKYKKAFTANQVILLQQGITQVISHETALNNTVRVDLLSHIKYADTLNKLILFLNSYVQWFAEDDFEKKYAMQPVIQELLQVAYQVDFPGIDNLLQLKDHYINHVIDEIVDELENALSWAVEANRGLGYLLERTAVTNAAQDILSAVAELRDASEPDVRQSALKNLYKVLMYHQVQLDGLWIFSLGHKNTRTLIQETLATLDGLTFIGNGQETLNNTFIQECKEQAIYHVMRERFNAALNKLEQDKAKLLNGHVADEWRQIKEQLLAIQNNCDSVYAFYEMNYFIVNKIALLGTANAELLAPLTQLRGEIQKIWDEYEQNHQELMDQSKYFEMKATKIKTEFEAMHGFSVNKVTLTSGHNGFSDYLDLVVEGRGTNPVLDGFAQYNSQLPTLTKMQTVIERQLVDARKFCLQLETLKDEQLPSLICKLSPQVDLTLFPADFRQQAQAIVQLNAYVLGKTPDDLSIFSETEQYSLQDRALVQTFTLDNLSSETIEGIQDPDLQAELMFLHEKIMEAAKPGSFWSVVTNTLSSALFYQESKTDWEEQLDELKEYANQQVRRCLRPIVKRQLAELTGAIDDVYQQTLGQVSALEEKLVFLAKQSGKEEAKGGVYCKRFISVTEFYQFEAQLQEARQVQEELFGLNMDDTDDDLLSDVSDFWEVDYDYDEPTDSFIFGN